MKCKSLKLLKVTGPCSTDAIGPLATHEELRMIWLALSTGIAKQDVPPELKSRVSFAKKPDFTKAMMRAKPGTKQSRPKSAVKLTPQERKAVAQLRKLLTTPDAASIVQGVELARSLESPAVMAVSYTHLTLPTKA